MALIDRIKEQAKAKKTRIVFPEGNEPRIIRGVDIVQSQGIADCVILGKKKLTSARLRLRRNSKA